MKKKDATLTMRLDKDIESEVIRYADENDISKSDAVRRILKNYFKTKKDFSTGK